MFNESNIGFANASPTITTLVAFLDSTSLHKRSGSNPREGMVTTLPPDRCGKNAPNHIPVPCIRGHPTRLTGNSLDAAFSLINDSISSRSSGTGKPMAKAVFIIEPRNKPCLYITPLGIPVVPPV